jgi:hypothetical protein
MQPCAVSSTYDLKNVKIWSLKMPHRKVFVALLAAIVGVVMPLRSQDKKPAITNGSVSSLSGFIGEWDCSGKFAVSNKSDRSTPEFQI